MKQRKHLVWASACVSFFLAVTAQFYFSETMRRGEPFGPAWVLIALVATVMVAPLIWRYVKTRVRD